MEQEIERIAREKWRARGKPKSLVKQMDMLMADYTRKGSKSSRRKEYRRLQIAVQAVQSHFRLDDIRKVGRRHVYWFDQQLAEQEQSSISTRKKYHNVWVVLFKRLDRTRFPRPPKK